MTVQMIRPLDVTAPQPERLRGTLLDVATVAPEGSYAWLDVNDVWESLNCLGARSTGVVCGSPGAKTFDSATWVDAAKFAAYAGVVCKAVGMSADLTARTSDLFSRIESRLVEQGLVEQVLSEQPAGADKTPTPGTAVTPQKGLAILEEYAAGNYAGVATLHVPRGMAQYLSQNGAIDASGSAWRTNVGTKVSAGGGYGLLNKGPNNVVPAAGKYWMWVTGEVMLFPGTLITADQLSRINNDHVILVERPYIAAVDCLVGAVLVEVP